MPAREKINHKVYDFMTCSKCGKTKRVRDNFYKFKNKDEWLNICKPCLTQFIDNCDPNTFKWILAKLDIPYVEHIWIRIANEEYTKNPAKFGNSSVIGLYLRIMKLSAWSKYGYADTDSLNAEHRKKLEEQEAAIEAQIAQLKEQLDNGEIDAAKYHDSVEAIESTPRPIEPQEFLPDLLEGKRSTITYITEDAATGQPKMALPGVDPMILLPTPEPKKQPEPPEPPPLPQPPDPIILIAPAPPPPKEEESPKPKKVESPKPEKVEPPPPEPEPKKVEPPPPPEPEPAPSAVIDIINEDDILSELEEEDMRYLALKWGINYKPSEWVFMEELYCKYTNEYELNADREDTLRKMCKTSLLLDRSLNEGEAQNAQKYAGILDGLRKSAKFTDSQKKEEQERFLDSVGELVAFCEKEGGIIKNLPDPDTYPQDKIDLTIRDLQNYTRNLATNELGLSNLIESYIAKLERREQEKFEDKLEDGLITSQEEEDAYYDREAVSYEDTVDFQDYIDTQIAEDSLMVLDLLEGES